MNSISKIYHSEACSICYEPYETTQANACLLLKCGHIFHESCVKKWIEEQHNCPTCRGRAFIPVLLKKILIEAGQQGIEGAKKSIKGIAITSAFITAYAVVHGTLNYLFPGNWPTTEEEIDAYINEHGVIFDLRKTEGFVRLGLTALAVIGISSTVYITQSLNQRRNQHVEVETAQIINYKPSADI